MLRACSRVLKPGGRLAFFVVAIADGLLAHDRAHAIEVGPEFVDAGAGYPALMKDAGFNDISSADITGEYTSTLHRSLSAREVERPHLEKLFGVERFAEGQAARRREMEAIEAGLLRRYLVTATSPR